MAAEQAAADRLLVLARGYEYATAREWALKIKELAHVFADPYSAADFQHGPLALARARRPGPRDRASRARRPMGSSSCSAGLRADHDAALAVASDIEDALALARWPLRLPPGTPEWLGPIVSIVVGQLHALHLTAARGLDPDAPRSISKVTLTR